MFTFFECDDVDSLSLSTLLDSFMESVQNTPSPLARWNEAIKNYCEEYREHIITIALDRKGVTYQCLIISPHDGTKTIKGFAYAVDAVSAARRWIDGR